MLYLVQKLVQIFSTIGKLVKIIEELRERSEYMLLSGCFLEMAYLGDSRFNHDLRALSIRIPHYLKEGIGFQLLIKKIGRSSLATKVLQ